MKRFFIMILAAGLLAGCKKDPPPPATEQLKAVRSTTTPYSVVEGSVVALDSYLTVTGGVPPYSYATSLSVGFEPSLQRIVPSVAQSPVVWGVYVRDSDGTTTSSPVVISLNITAPQPPIDDTALAFPTAEGGGKYTTGGRGGRVIYVTTLADEVTNPPVGSLRWALNQTGTRIIMFKVSGIIELKGKLHLRNDANYAGRGENITIAGESAPGDGICLKDWPLSVYRAKNVIIRFMRFRLGDDVDTGGGQDAFDGRQNENIIIDHCSMSWSVDECSSWYVNRNFTMQWCILTEALRLSNHEKGSAHGYGAIWGGKDVSYHHNLLSRNDSRNPRFDATSSYNAVAISEWRGAVDFRNNAVYDWGGEVSYGGEGGWFNMVNNFYKEGPYSPVRNRFFTAYTGSEEGVPQAPYAQLYMSGNYYQTKAGAPVNTINNDNRLGIVWNTAGVAMPSTYPTAEFTILGQSGGALIATETAAQAFASVIAGAGAFPRDNVDTRATTDAANGTITGYVTGAEPSKQGMVDHPSQVGGWGTYAQGTVPTDTDGDGMPDEWEQAKGLNKTSPDDGSAYTLSTVYTNVEVYLHELAASKIGH